MKTPGKQQGTVLMVSLVLLFIMTLLGLSSIRSTQMQEKMSANTQNKVASFQATEAAVVAGEQFINSLLGEPIPAASCAAQPCILAMDVDLYLDEQTSAWWAANGALYAGGVLNDIATNPYFVIQYERFVPDTPVLGKGGAPTGSHYYRVTARGTGYTAESQSIIQTTFTRRY